jgi:hypothetical protein
VPSGEIAPVVTAALPLTLTAPVPLPAATHREFVDD